MCVCACVNVIPSCAGVCSVSRKRELVRMFFAGERGKRAARTPCMRARAHVNHSTAWPTRAGRAWPAGRGCGGRRGGGRGGRGVRGATLRHAQARAARGSGAAGGLRARLPTSTSSRASRARSRAPPPPSPVLAGKIRPIRARSRASPLIMIMADSPSTEADYSVLSRLGGVWGWQHEAAGAAARGRYDGQRHRERPGACHAGDPTPPLRPVPSVSGHVRARWGSGAALRAHADPTLGTTVLRRPETVKNMGLARSLSLSSPWSIASGA